MLSDRRFNEYELRQILSMKEHEIQSLRTENYHLKNEVKTLSGWNYRWQKHRWNEALLEGCDSLEKEIKGLSDIQTRILEYLSETHDGTARHIRAVARALGISPSTAHANLRLLAQKRLIRCYLRQSHLRKYYCLPDAQKLVQHK